MKAWLAGSAAVLIAAFAVWDLTRTDVAPEPRLGLRPLPEVQEIEEAIAETVSEVQTEASAPVSGSVSFPTDTVPVTRAFLPKAEYRRVGSIVGWLRNTGLHVTEEMAMPQKAWYEVLRLHREAVKFRDDAWGSNERMQKAYGAMIEAKVPAPSRQWCIERNLHYSWTQENGKTVYSYTPHTAATRDFYTVWRTQEAAVAEATLQIARVIRQSGGRFHK